MFGCKSFSKTNAIPPRNSVRNKGRSPVNHRTKMLHERLKFSVAVHSPSESYDSLKMFHCFYKNIHVSSQN